jgi:hypothetical protein
MVEPSRSSTTLRPNASSVKLLVNSNSPSERSSSHFGTDDFDLIDENHPSSILSLESPSFSPEIDKLHDIVVKGDAFYSRW